MSPNLVILRHFKIINIELRVTSSGLVSESINSLLFSLVLYLKKKKQLYAEYGGKCL